MSLRKEIIRLAHCKPELRKHLLPLITTDKTAGQKGLWTEILAMLLPRGWKLGGGDLYSITSVEKVKGKEYVLVLRIMGDMLDMEIIHDEKDKYGGYVTSNHEIEDISRHSLRNLQKEVSDFVKDVIS